MNEEDELPNPIMWCEPHKEPGKIGGKCLRCGSIETVKMPCCMDAFGHWLSYFMTRHKNCKEAARGVEAP